MLEAMIRMVIDWWQRQQTIHQLRGLDDKSLIDLGTRREDIECFVADLEWSGQ